MDSPIEDAIASESTRMWYFAKPPWKSRVAMRDAQHAVPSRCPLTLAREPRSRSSAATVASSALVTSATSTHTLAALGERVGVLPLVRCDVTLARGVVEGAVGLHAALSASQHSAADVLACAAEGVRAASVARRLATAAAQAVPSGSGTGAEGRVEVVWRRDSYKRRSGSSRAR